MTVSRYIRKINFSLISGKYILAVCIMFFTFSVYSQNTCTQKLERAEKLYDSGQIDKVAELLKTCLESGFSKEEKARAYRLLTLCNLYYNEDEEAAKTMFKLLKVKPEYEIKEFDPSEFVAMHKSFRTKPVFITGVKYGVGFLNFRNIVNYKDINSVVDTTYYKPLSSYFNFGVSVETPIYKDFSISYEFFYNKYSYEYHTKVLNYTKVDFQETFSSLNIPIMLQWNILKKDFVPYVNVGGSFNYLLNSEASFIRADKDVLGDEYRQEIKIDKLDLINSRNRVNYSLCAGVGFRWKNLIWNGYLTFDIRYSMYFNNLVESEKRADNQEMLFTGLISDNSFKFQNTMFLIGYKVPLYLPKYKGSKK